MQKKDFSILKTYPRYDVICTIVPHCNAMMLFGLAVWSPSGDISPRIIFSKFSKMLWQFAGCTGDKSATQLGNLTAGLSLCRIAEQSIVTISDQFNISATFGKASNAAITGLARLNLSGASVVSKVTWPENLAFTGPILSTTRASSSVSLCLTSSSHPEYTPLGSRHHSDCHKFLPWVRQW